MDNQPNTAQGDLSFVLANKYLSNLNVFEIICWIIIIIVKVVIFYNLTELKYSKNLNKYIENLLNSFHKILKPFC